MSYFVNLSDLYHVAHFSDYFDLYPKDQLQINLFEAGEIHQSNLISCLTFSILSNDPLCSFVSDFGVLDVESHKSYQNLYDFLLSNRSHSSGWF